VQVFSPVCLAQPTASAGHVLLDLTHMIVTESLLVVRVIGSFVEHPETNSKSAARNNVFIISNVT